VITLLASIILSPWFPTPDPSQPGPGVNLMPNYITNGDGTRWQCTPNLAQCQPSRDGLPSYLTGA